MNVRWRRVIRCFARHISFRWEDKPDRMIPSSRRSCPQINVSAQKFRVQLPQCEVIVIVQQWHRVFMTLGTERGTCSLPPCCTDRDPVWRVLLVAKRASVGHTQLPLVLRAERIYLVLVDTVRVIVLYLAEFLLLAKLSIRLRLSHRTTGHRQCDGDEKNPLHCNSLGSAAGR
jgi:hypothetical protein